MECLAQYLDDIEDLFFAVVAQAENILRTLKFAAFTLVAVAVQLSCVALAMTSPPLAAASAAILAVAMLYRSVVYNMPMANVAA